MNVSVHLRSAYVSLEKLSISKDLNNTSLPRSGASEILDLMGDSWLNSPFTHIDSSDLDNISLNKSKKSPLPHEDVKFEGSYDVYQS